MTRLRFALFVLPCMLLAAGGQDAGDQKAGGQKASDLKAGGQKAGGQNPGDRNASGPSPSSHAATAVDSEAPTGLPAGAVKIGPYRWRYADAQGKVWMYRDTPFGLTRVPDQKPPEEVAPPNWKAVRVGDEIQFERPTPFGGMRWTKKEDQLDSLERKVWERDRPKSEPAAQPAGSTGPAKE
ncbi:MAG: hypothetical protein ACLQGV_10150 [Bryobacteraceae bacterium]